MSKVHKKTAKSARKQVNILGINVDSTTRSRVLAAVDRKISHNSKFFILTPNPELVLASTKDKNLKAAFNAADFAIPDGFGLKLADLSLNIIKGRELFLSLMDLANKRGWRAFFLGGLGNEAEIAAKKFGAAFTSGPKLNVRGEPTNESEARVEAYSIRKINEYKPDLLFVAFKNPRQEIWIHEHLSKLDVRGAMAVGGTFRYIAGMSKLPPTWLGKIGFEWLWRLITEPFRLRRIYNAVILFPLKLLQSKLWKTQF